MEIKNYMILPGIPKAKPNAYKILDSVCKDFGISMYQLRMRKRKPEFVYARYFAAIILRENTSLSLWDIAKLVGNGDHSTVIYGMKKIKNEMPIYPEIKERYERLKNTILTL